MKFWNNLPKAEDGYFHVPAWRSRVLFTALLAVLAPVTQVSVECVRCSEPLPAVGLCAIPEEEGLCAWEVGCPGSAEGISTHYPETMVTVLLLRWPWLWAALLWLRRVMRLPFRGGFSWVTCGLQVPSGTVHDGSISFRARTVASVIDWTHGRDSSRQWSDSGSSLS